MQDKLSYKVDHRYEILKTLGDGLSGEVVLVRDKDGEKALKFLKKVQLNVSREDALKNFKNEFEILKKLNHPHIARILDFGFDNKLQKYYFTSEFVSGAILDKACEGQSLDVVEKLVVQVLRALNYLHSRGVYHFDIKPQNILVNFKDGQPIEAKIIDFGLAGYASPRKRVGTPAFMAPEVVQGGHLDGRTDLYSLGIVIYKIFSGMNPFVSKNLKETLERQVNFTPPPIMQIRGDVPEYWDHILRRLLEKNPIKRYSQASLAIRDLNFLSNKQIEIETRDTKLSYLPEKGILIGREKEWDEFACAFEYIFNAEKPSDRKLFIMAGSKGTGKSRLMSEIKSFSQIRNVPVKSLAQFENKDELGFPFILMIEENELSADGVNALLQDLPHERCLIVWATEKAPNGWTNATVVTLGCYSKPDLKKYLEAVTGLTNVPEKLLEEIYNRTQGNPLFVTEFVKTLLDQDLLFDASGKWDAATFDDIKIDFDSLNIPDSVESYLLANYKALVPLEAEIAEWLSLNQSDLEIDQIQTLVTCGPNAGADVHEAILSLIEKNIIRKTSREMTYYFQNIVMEDVIKNSLSESVRELRHDRLAALFAGKTVDVERHLFHLGYGSDKAKAKDALAKLGESYREKQDYSRAARAYEKLKTLGDENKNQYWRSVSYSLAGVYTESQQNEKAAALLMELLEATKACADTSEREEHLEVLVKFVIIRIRQSLMDEVEALLKHARDVIGNDVASIYLNIFENFRGYVKFMRGEIEEAKAIYLATHETWLTKLDDEARLKVTNNRLYEVYLLQNKYDEAIEFCQQSIAVLKKSKLTVRLATLYYSLGVIYYRLTVDGRAGVKVDCTELCLESFKESQNIANQFCHYNTMMSSFNGMGNLYWEKGDDEQALKYYQRALPIARKVSDLNVAATIALNMGAAYKRMGKVDDAYTYLVYALNTFEGFPVKNSNTWLFIVMCRVKLAEIYHLRKQFDRAHKMLDQCEEIIRDKAYLAPHLFRKHFLKLKIYKDEGRQADFEAELVCVRELATGISDKDDLEKYLAEIKHGCLKEKLGSVEAKTGGLKMILEQPMSGRDGEDLKKIIEINNFINTEHNLDQLLKIVLNYALQLSKAEVGFVILLDEDGSFIPAASLNAQSDDEEKVSMSVVKMALESGEIVSSADAFTDERFDASDSIVMNELKSVLCLPIKSKNKCVGVFYLDNRYKVNVFETCNVALLKAFCDQVGIAMENAKLIGQLQDAQKKLEERLQQTEEELAEARTLLVEEGGVFKSKYSYSNIISKSKEMQDVFKLLDKVTETSLSMFLHGESGTGKELVAKALHYNNPTRGSKRFVAINCGAIPSNLMESELFGHKQGSFTGALRDKKGMFEDANGGTLFLDEIGELAPELQVKLLRVLQEGEVQRIGDNHAIKVDVRIVSASLKDIESMVKAGKFREDLYYRLCQMRINLPGLKNRKDDIPSLAKHFVKKYCQQNKIEGQVQIPPEFMKALLEYDWPGNIRELENMIYVACALQDGGRLSLENLPDHYGMKKMLRSGVTSMAVANLQAIAENPSLQSYAGDPSSSEILIDGRNRFDSSKNWRDYEAIIIAKCYQSSDRKKKLVADSLDLSHSTVYKKIEELGLDDTSNPIYAEKFSYEPGVTMQAYVRLVFQASLKYHDNHPYAAIKQLGVSQGYFYKIIKQGKAPAEESDVTES